MWRVLNTLVEQELLTFPEYMSSRRELLTFPEYLSSRQELLTFPEYLSSRRELLTFSEYPKPGANPRRIGDRVAWVVR
jgi:hypothetical protein